MKLHEITHLKMLLRDLLWHQKNLLWHCGYLQWGLTPDLVSLFQNIIGDYYEAHGRIFPWRLTSDPYAILVSEIMLQQTQISRVLLKYERFITHFPGFAELAQAPLSDILDEWQGLGYNRRAISLKKIAETVINVHQGMLPSSNQELCALPGVGNATAAAIQAFAYNKPVVFIETNIRSVYLYFFFRHSNHVNDKSIMPLIEKTLDSSNPRRWYYALMDYGVMLKKYIANPNQRSAHYKIQSRFQGSDRQLRGMILRLLLKQKAMTIKQIEQQINRFPEKIKKIISQLSDEGFLYTKRGKICLNK